MVKKAIKSLFSRLIRKEAAPERPGSPIKHSEPEAPASPGPDRAGERDRQPTRPPSGGDGERQRPPRPRSGIAKTKSTTVHHQPRGVKKPDAHLAVAERLAAGSDFRTLELDDRVLAAVADLGFVNSTPIQRETLPHSLVGRDISGRAQTGTGKTAAFLITIIQKYLHSERPTDTVAPMALVLAPTRELAIQIDKDAQDLSAYTGLRTLCVYGGMDYDKQVAVLAAGVDLITATPGRLIDYLRNRLVDLSKVDVLVIDEADRMLDMGFIPDVRRIVSRVPPVKNRQTMLFSATLTEYILQLAGQWLHDPITVEIDVEQVVANDIEQIVYAVAARDKLALLIWLLRNEVGERALVFRNRRDSCERLVRELTRYGVNCALMSGDVPQKKRLKVLEGFRQGLIPVIVATDVAGRGIHVDDISHVINYDLPYEPDDYVHRIGRTGRAGTKGRAVAFACEESAFVLPEIEEYIKESLKSVQPEPEMLKLPHPVHPPTDRKVESSRARPGGGSRRPPGGRGAPRRRGPR